MHLQAGPRGRFPGTGAGEASRVNLGLGRGPHQAAHLCRPSDLAKEPDPRGLDRSRKQTGELSLSPDVGGPTAGDAEPSWVPESRGWKCKAGSSLPCLAFPSFSFQSPVEPRLPMSRLWPDSPTLPLLCSRWHLPSIRADSTAFPEELGSVQAIFRCKGAAGAEGI